jgi:hypothetical protein
MTSMWIGPDDSLTTGQTGFLVEKSNEVRGWTRYELRDIPAHTNQSNEPRLHGWCGTNNDLATFGRGLVRVTRVARNGRAFVVELKGDELQAGLEELGYPDLAAE